MGGERLWRSSCRNGDSWHGNPGGQRDALRYCLANDISFSDAGYQSDAGTYCHADSDTDRSNGHARSKSGTHRHLYGSAGWYRHSDPRNGYSQWHNPSFRHADACSHADACAHTHQCSDPDRSADADA